MRKRINIVQVHLGPMLPPYIYDQLRQTRAFNQEENIYFILNSTAVFDRAVFEELGVIAVRRESLSTCRNHRLFLRRNRLSRRWLGGFWIYTAERFFAMESFLEACNLTDVVHMENDVMLYASLDLLRPALVSRCQRMGITMDSERRCVPGFIFIHEPEALSAMNDFIVSNSMRERHTDMEALAAYMKASNPDHCSALPVIPERYRQLNPLVNAKGEQGSSPWYDEAYGEFGGIFDAASLGQYLGGIDTRGEDRDTIGFVNETAVYDPRKMGLHWKSAEGLRRPYGEVDRIEFPIFNLHIHSKRLAEFSSCR